MAVDAGLIRLKLGAGRPHDANRRRRSDAHSNSKSELMTQIYVRTPTTHLGGFYYRLAGACGLRPHPSGASRVGYTRRSLATLAFDPRARPRCKGEPSLRSCLTQESLLTISVYHVRASQKYPHSGCKCKVSLHSPLLHFASFHCKASHL